MTRPGVAAPGERAGFLPIPWADDLWADDPARRARSRRFPAPAAPPARGRARRDGGLEPGALPRPDHPAGVEGLDRPRPRPLAVRAMAAPARPRGARSRCARREPRDRPRPVPVLARAAVRRHEEAGHPVLDELAHRGGVARDEEAAEAIASSSDHESTNGTVR